MIGGFREWTGSRPSPSATQTVLRAGDMVRRENSALYSSPLKNPSNKIRYRREGSDCGNLGDFQNLKISKEIK